MQLAKLITLKGKRLYFLIGVISVLFTALSFNAVGQENSPYSRYGLGDLTPGTNITTRGMGGVSAGYADILSINFDNPASYANFQAWIEQHSKKVASGRVILDVGVNFDNPTISQPNSTNSFASSDAYFNYIQVGLPIKKNWGLSFGIRPLSRIGYNITSTTRLSDPNTGTYIDTVVTNYRGSGGSYLPSIGTGFAIKNLSLGANVGYLFGNRQANTLLSFNDTLSTKPTNYQTLTSFGSLFFNVGMQYVIYFNKEKNTLLRIGASGNWQQNVHASQDQLRQTFVYGTAGDIQQVDSVYAQSAVKGTIQYPASYKAGLYFQNINKDASGWAIGIDYSKSQWSNYRFYGQQDSVRDSWLINVGGQIFPKPGNGYFSHVTYRAGFYSGRDYVRTYNQLPIFGVSLGFGLPIRNYNRLSPNQASMLNLAFEFANRGSNNSPLKENLFRLSVGFSFTDLWFGKHKYE